MNRVQIKWFISIVILFSLLFFQLPYFYSQPGSALVLNDLITVEDGYEEKGAFMLTTVKMGRATIPIYLWAKLNSNLELHPMKQLKYDGESDEEYHERQLFMMKQSQDAAKIVAYRHANKRFTVNNKGVVVIRFIDGMPAKEVLQPGDRIIAVDGKAVQTADELMRRFNGKSLGETVSLTVVRNGKTHSVEVAFAPFPDDISHSEQSIGIGIVNPITYKEITFEQDVHIDTSEIGGPSAGLMFALEIYNQLVPEDMTKGYQIAGTGTLNEDGTVGRIGGAGQKVVAAHKAGADYFFAPNEKGASDSNYVEALRVAERIGTTMEIVPVDTFADALQFLQSLPEK